MPCSQVLGPCEGKMQMHTVGARTRFSLKLAANMLAQKDNMLAADGWADSIVFGFKD